VINNKSAPLPEGDDVRGEVERFLRRLGYRLVLVELKHPPSIKQGEQLQLAMQWQNTGSAPCYRPYRLAYRLANERLQQLVVGTVTVEQWLPGEIPLFTDAFLRQPADLPPGQIVNVSDTTPLPIKLPPDRYTLSLAVVSTETLTPIVQLGIQGRDEQGWYPLSKITVTEP